MLSPDLCGRAEINKIRKKQRRVKISNSSEVVAGRLLGQPRVHQKVTGAILVSSRSGCNPNLAGRQEMLLSNVSCSRGVLLRN